MDQQTSALLKENSLRDWLRGRFSASELEWVEPGWGAREGLPDVNLLADGLRLPIELKAWDVTKWGVKFELRPSQHRYHRFEASRRRKTAVLGLVRAKRSQPYILLVPGSFFPREPYPANKTYAKKVCDYHGTSLKNKSEERASLMWLLKSEAFWSNA